MADAVVAQSLARRLASEVGCSERLGWEYAIAVSEAASNIVKHAGSGEIRLRVVRSGPPYLELEVPEPPISISTYVTDTRRAAT